MQDVPCSPEMQGACPVFQRNGQCYEDSHHIYWPSSDYTTKTEKRFRQLEVNKVVLCRWVHNTIHAVVLPPEQPTVQEMRTVINDQNNF